MKIGVDEGFFFGLGVFETVAVCGGRPVLLREHLERLERGMEFLGISRRVTEQEVYDFLEQEKQCGKEEGNRILSQKALKIVVSEKNTLFLPRENPYTERDYEKGFAVDFARARRNETSPFTYHKTLNYGDCIMERRYAAANGRNEAVFLNGQGEICEGTASNIFFVRDGRIVTPELSAGLLPGVMRRYLLERYDIAQERISGEAAERFEECFLTNSLMGIMPVTKFGKHRFAVRTTADRLREEYIAFLTFGDAKRT